MGESNFARMPMAWTTMWDDMPTQDCIDFVRKMHPPGHHGAFEIHEPPAETGFAEYACDLLATVMVIDKMKWWVSIIHKDSTVRKGWVEGFPHAHGWDNGRTLVQLIQLPYKGGELVVWDGEKQCAPIDLKAGMGVIIGGETKHGVRPVREDRQRITMIATAFGKEIVDV